MKLDEKQELRLILKRLAEENGVSVEQVKSDIRKAIDETWAIPDSPFKARQRKLFPNGKPSIAEFIYKMSQTVMETDDKDE